MKILTMILMLGMAFAVSATSAQAQTAPVNISISSQSLSPSAKVADEVTFYVFITIEQRKEATGVTLTAQLPEGITPTSVLTGIYGTCAFEGNLITCNFPKLGRTDLSTLDYNALIIVKARPVASGIFTLTTSITANEPDPDLSNNTGTASVLVQSIKSRKRVRIL